MMPDLTTNERLLLMALAARPAQALTPAALREELPAIFGDRSVEGLHQTGASLARKSLVWHGTGGDGRATYQIRPEVLAELGVDQYPAQDTPARAVWVAAIDVATSPPLRANRSGGVSQALVPWREIQTLREALDALGIDWRKVWDGRRG